MKPSRDQMVTALWKAGDLSYLLHEDQERVRDVITESSARVFVAECSRRWGKSLAACVLAAEQCLQRPNSQVRYAAPTAKMVKTIVEPHMRRIFADAPPSLRPEYRVQDGVWSFPNGSQLHVAGTDNGGADRLRGVATHLAIVDEAGFVDDLEYLVQDVLLPQLLTTNGRVLLVSTPPRTPAHAFTAYAARARTSGAHVLRTIFDAPHITESRREEFCREAGGAESTTWRREYLCEHVVDETLAVLPEFQRVEARIVQKHPRPAHFTPLIVMDVGFHDLTFALFGYHDFTTAIDVIEAEWSASKVIAKDINRAVDRISTALWGLEKAREAKRYADTPSMQLAELNQSRTLSAAIEAEREGMPLPVQHDGWLPIAKTQTDGNFKAAAVNDVRTRLAEGSMRLDPSCTELVSHCRYAVWRVPGRDLERMEGFGHFDGVDTLTYFVRLVDRFTNPTPLRDPSTSSFTHWLNSGIAANDQRETMALLGGARRR